MWLDLVDEMQLDSIVQQSFERPQLLFKHSTRCGISLHAKYELDTSLANLASVADLYYLDLLNYRPISALIALKFGVVHQSPQVIVLHNGEVVYHASHQAIKSHKLIALMTLEK